MTEILHLDDREVVRALLLRNQKVTQQYLYVKCYPLFKAVFDNYYTDCQTCIEFINEIYIHMMTPGPQTGVCKLETFQFRSTLTTWLKTVAVFYCYEHFRRKKKVMIEEQFSLTKDGVSDRLDAAATSMYEEQPMLGTHDLEVLLDMMPNRRYSQLIRLRYVEEMSNEDTAKALGMTMDNYYNKHRRAKMQLYEIINKETRRYE